MCNQIFYFHLHKLIDIEIRETEANLSHSVTKTKNVTQTLTYTQKMKMEMEGSIAAVEKIIGYTFLNKKLLEDALTHISYLESVSYERL